MAVASDQYRSAGRLFASGVTVVTAAADGRFHGMTATAVAFVSLEPPLLLVCLERNSRTRRQVEQHGRFAVNVLTADQEEIAQAFALAGDKSLEGIPFHPDDAGNPLFDEALAGLSCRTTEVVDAGDHGIFVAEVLHVETRPGRPLVYFDRGYRSLD
jgi:4-nitrophenol 2-monooxygenase / 4-nitrocatechol 4-monooxygenase, reductase component